MLQSAVHRLKIQHRGRKCTTQVKTVYVCIHNHTWNTNEGFKGILKVARDLVCLSSCNSEFNRVGALTETVWSSLVTRCDLGVTRKAPSIDLRGNEGRWQVNSSLMKLWPWQFRALKVSNQILESILHLTGS